MKTFAAVVIISLLLLSSISIAYPETEYYIVGGRTTTIYSGNSSGSGTMNQTINLTANMTAGPAGIINNSYYLRDNSLPLTSEKVKRDVDNDLLTIYGGDAIAGGTGIISLFGKDSANPNDVEIVAGDGGAGNSIIAAFRGGASPVMDMNIHSISNLLDPVTGQDAASKNYVDIKVGNVTGSSPVDTTQFLWLNGTRIMTGNLSAPAVNNITTISNPTDAVNKSFVETSPTVVNLSAIYPVGSVYITTTTTDPSALFNGFGTWQSLGTGYVLVGV